MGADKVNILLVDDHPANLTALEATLEGLGQNLVTAHSAREALRHVLQQDFAVIVLDVQMPEIDGFEAAVLIRERKRSQHTPIVFVTAISKEAEQIARGYSLGAVDYIVKPFDPDTMRAKIAAFVQMAQNTQRLHAEILRRKEAETEVRELNAELERRVRERTSAVEALNMRLQQMMTETHHRVKNNLQILAAMVDLQVMEDKPQLPVEVFRRFGMHIRSLAVVHDLLTQQAKENMESTLLSTEMLLQKIFSLMQQISGGRKLHFQVDEVLLQVRQGTSLCLIVNELISNAFKHGKGEIFADFEVSDGGAILKICDDGSGFPPNFNLIKDANTGLQLVVDLTKHDLGGQVRFENRPEGGACVTVSFPIDQE